MGLSTASTQQLRRLRVRVLILITLLSIAVVAVFSAAVLRLDQQRRAEATDAELAAATARVASAVGGLGLDAFATDLSPLLDDSVVVVTQPPIDPFEAIIDSGREDEIVYPTEEEVKAFIEDFYYQQDSATQDELLASSGSFELSRNERIEVLFDQPPPNVYDAAEGMLLLDIAAEAGIELSNPPTVSLTASSILSPDLALDATRQAERHGPESLNLVEGLQVKAVRLGQPPDGAIYVLAAADPATDAANHADVRRGIFAIAIALTGVAAMLAWFVAGRAIQPTADALSQQEQFLANAAHELRTPITAIRTRVEAPHTTPDEALDTIQRVTTLAIGMSQLTDDLLTLAQMDANRIELTTTPTRLDALVEVLLDSDPRFRLLLTPVVADIDARLIERCISNLATNAALHGGATAMSPAEVTVDQTGVAITDNGPGLDTSLGNQAFDRFTTGPSSGGHGLGLPLSMWIARAHGGDLILENDPGRGVRAHLQLATTDPQAPSASHREPPSNP